MASDAHTATFLWDALHAKRRGATLLVCVCVGVLTGLPVWVYHNYCLCLWPFKARVMIAFREQSTDPSLRTWGTWVDVKGLTESKGLSLARHKHLPTVSAVSTSVYWKTKALVETLNLRGTPGITARRQLFVARLVFVLGFARSSCLISSPMQLSFFFLKVVPNTGQQRPVKVCEEQSLKTKRICGFFKLIN